MPPGKKDPEDAPDAPDARGRPAEASGSIDVEVSGATPVAITDDDSAPVSSGRVRAVVAGEPSTRNKAITNAAHALGTGVGAIGHGVEVIGRGVGKLGDATTKIPLVGAGVTALGGSISEVGESLSEIPRVARTKRGQVLIRSTAVGFVVVCAWIALIVGWQIHTEDTPDFRPLAEHILVQLSASKAGVDEAYEAASPRFQEVERKEQFEDRWADLAVTLGKFREITAVNETLVTTGPTGRIGRVSLTVAFDKATCKGSVSLHYDNDRWKLLGVGMELPIELKVTQAQREERVAACKDPMDAKNCDVHVTAAHVMTQIKGGDAGGVWDAATEVFQKQEDRATFVQVQAERRVALGPWTRFVSVTEAKVIGGTSAYFDALGEYEKGVARTAFGFTRSSRTEPWRLRSLKIVVPMPRPDDEQPAVPKPGKPAPAPALHDAGVAPTK